MTVYEECAREALVTFRSGNSSDRLYGRRRKRSTSRGIRLPGM
jgi:hypothetical protein